MGNVCPHEEEPHPHDAETKGAPVPVSRGIALEMDFKEAMLHYTNIARAAHGAPDVEWCDECAANAQAQADYCASIDNLEHGNCDDEGQNAAMNYEGLDETANAKGAVAMWYDEVNDPGYNYEGDFGAGHFTQLVWKGCTKMGAGYNGRWVFANYDAGNMMGEYGDNVDAECNGDVSELQENDDPPSGSGGGGGGGYGYGYGGDDEWEYY